MCCPDVWPLYMSIEVTSVSDPSRKVSIRRLFSSCLNILKTATAGPKGIVIRATVCLLVIALILCADALVRSYKYYANIIDDRLAAGYLTSRPGLYAASRVLAVGQRLSPDDLVNELRRAGYVESGASSVHLRQSRFSQPETLNGNQESCAWFSLEIV